MDIQLQKIHKSYRNSPQSPVRQVLHELDLQINQGEMIALMGPSGSGKTTLLNILGTLDSPDSGELIFGEKNVNTLSQDDVLKLRNRHIGFVFQFHFLLPQCTLLENVLLPTLANNEDKKTVLHRAEELLQMMGVWDYRHQKPDALSGGECQRAAVARALINQPEILLADEPTGSLDQENADKLLKLLLDINNKLNVTLVIATHAPEVAKQMHKIYHLHEMKLQEERI
jgi:ABC-type lipoprotein export system ATPase subunit